LRHGPVTEADLAAMLGGASLAQGSGKIEAPGQMTSHYAPGKPLRLNADAPEGDEFFISFGGVGGDFALSAEADLAEAAARLYAALHAGAAGDQARIAVSAIPEGGIGAAINDRLRRAAAPVGDA